MTRRLTTRLVLAATVLSLAACAGYRVGPAKPTAMQGVATLAVPNVKNNTLEPRVDVMLTNAIISRLQEDGTYRVAREGAADAVLEVTLVRLERRQLRSARFNTLRSRELGLVADLEYRVVDLRTQEVISTGSVRGDTTIFADANYQNAERQAMPEVARRAAERLVSRIAEGW
jgi:hypothetical protein